jgi:hypothetical protein
VQKPDCMETVEDACASSSAFDLVGTLGYFMSVCSRCVLTLELDFSRASNSILSQPARLSRDHPLAAFPSFLWFVQWPRASPHQRLAVSYGGCARMAA